MSTEMEVLLRPPVEIWSGSVSVSAASLCLMTPDTLMMSPSVAYTSALVLASLGVLRMQQGARILKYQRNLKRLPRYEMTTNDIPTYKNYLFLGKGFKWGQVHTQRLKDTLSPAARKFVEPSRMYNAAREFERSIEGTLFEGIGKLTQIDSALNPFRPLPPVGGKPAIHAVEPNEVDVLLPCSERVGHTLVLGTTRVGKTRLAEILIEQDIRRNEGPVIVFDPKSDADLLTRMYMSAKDMGREDDFYCFHLGFPEISAKYNGVGNFSRITEVAGRISGQLSSEGNSAAFKEFAWRFVNIVARTLVALGVRPDYNNILRHVTDIEPLFEEYMEFWIPKNCKGTAWIEEMNALTKQAEEQYKKNPRFNKHSSPKIEALRKFLESRKVSDPVVLGLLSALRYDRTYFDKIVASLLPLLEKLTTGKIAELVAPDYLDVNDERPIFDWTQIIRKKGIVYIGLDAMSDMEVASAVGNSMFADLVSTSGQIYKHGFEHGMLDGKDNVMPKVCLHCDEFEGLMGDEFLPMVNKSGGSGMQVTAYTQARGDIEARMGSSAKARQIEGNFNNLIMLRVKEPDTAELLTSQLPEVEISQIMSVSSASDSADTESSVDFTSNTQDRTTTLRVPMLETSHITGLPKGQAFCLLDGGHLWKVRIPYAKKDNTEDMPENLKALAKVMKENYVTSEAWWE